MSLRSFTVNTEYSSNFLIQKLRPKVLWKRRYQALSFQGRCEISSKVTLPKHKTTLYVSWLKKRSSKIVTHKLRRCPLMTNITDEFSCARLATRTCLVAPSVASLSHDSIFTRRIEIVLTEKRQKYAPAHPHSLEVLFSFVFSCLDFCHFFWHFWGHNCSRFWDGFWGHFFLPFRVKLIARACRQYCR